MDSEVSALFFVCPNVPVLDMGSFFLGIKDLMGLMVIKSSTVNLKPWA